ncbi:MAG: MG2 domain-containing protein, partial [Litorivicinus sp.]
MPHFLILSLWLASAVATAQPSFSCAGRVSAPERMICDSAALSALDNELAAAFADATRNTTELAELRKRQAAWVVERDRCLNSQCLSATYQARIATVNALTRPLDNSDYTAGRGKGEVRYALKKAIDPTASLGPFVRVTDAAGREVEHGILLQDRVLTITGLEPSTGYDVRFRKGLPLSAGVLAADQVVRANTPALRPGLNLLNGRGVVTLPAGKSPVVQYRATGRKALHLRVSGILPAVAIRALQSGGLDALGYTDSADEKLLHEQIIPLETDRYGQAEGAIRLGDLGLPAGTASVIDVSACQDAACNSRYDRESMTVVPSAMAISAARAGDAIWVSVRDYKTAEMARSGSLTLYARNSEALGRFPIEQDGYARIPEALLQGKNGQRPSLLKAQNAQGDSYLSLLDSPLSLSQLPVQGATASALGSAYLRTERGVYRPSELVYFSGIARARDQRALGSADLLLEVIRPDGKRIERRPVKSDHNGLVTATLQLGAIAKRG